MTPRQWHHAHPLVVPLGWGSRVAAGVRLWIDGRLVVSNWTTHTLTENRGSIALTADRAHDIRLEFFDQTGSATIRLLWSGSGTPQRTIPSAALLSG